MTEAVAELAERAQTKGAQLAVAESLTCGRLANAIGAGDSALDWFRGGVVAYQVSVKERVLGVAPGIDPCSPECAEQLASGVRELLHADLAVSVTGVGGPDPEDGHPPGTVYLGWATADRTGHTLRRFEGSPEDVIDASVAAAIDTLLRELARLP